MNRICVLPLLLLTALASADKVDDFVTAQMKAQQIPGLVVGVLKDGKFIKKQAYGKSDLELDVNANTDNLFEIGSITKEFTAMGALLLVEQGKLNLDDPVTKYLDDAPKSWSDVKIRHLLYQISGLPDYALVPGIGLLDEFTRETFMKKMGELPLDYTPGLAWSYSNTNYALMGWVIEKASGERYADFMTKNVLKPAGMTHTFYNNISEITKNRAHGYFLTDNGQMIMLKGSAGSIQSDGTLVSCVDDMARWDETLRGRKILKPSSYDLMFSPAKLNSGRTRAYGCGMNLTLYKDAPYVGHGGNSVGYSAGYAQFIDAHISVIVLGNVYAFSGEGMARQIAALYDPSVRPSIPKETTDPDSKRTDRVKAALAKLAAQDPDESLLEPEVYIPFKTGRAKMGNGFAFLKKLDAIAFVGAEPQGKDTMLTYRITASGRKYTLFALWSNDGKLASALTKVDPAPTN